MMTYAARRLRNIVLFLLPCLLLAGWYAAHRGTLGDARAGTGWLLFWLCLFLAAYNVRKKLPFLPLGRSATWLQLHAYAGVFAILVYGYHVGFAFPRGLLNALLATLFLATALSGVVGIVLSRLVPMRLARRGEEVLYERIPAFRRVLRDRAEAVVLRAVAEMKSPAVADFYQVRLAPFFEGPRHFWAHVLGSGEPRRRIHHEVSELRGALRDEDRPLLDELVDALDRKDDLDFHWANQGILKFWFFAHIPLTYALLLFTVAHVVLVHAFGAVR